MKRLSTRERQGEIRVMAGNVELEGNLCLPEMAEGIVLFAHGSGSSRHSKRNRFVAHYLNEHHLGTLLLDLLSLDEEALDLETAQLRFDIPFLAERLLCAINWLEQDARTEKMKIGLFGSSTGGGAALLAAAEQPDSIQAVVSRGGRPDLAADALIDVRCPTLLVVGGNDFPVIKLNQEALEKLSCVKKLEIVPHATHLFEERGALEEVARLASNWFQKYLI